jgi:hypothetical protein
MLSLSDPGQNTTHAEVYAPQRSRRASCEADIIETWSKSQFRSRESSMTKNKPSSAEVSRRSVLHGVACAAGAAPILFMSTESALAAKLT